MKHGEYYFTRTIDMSFDRAIARTKEELGREGFGILTEIDVTATLKKKLDVEFKPYRILGACNPPYAHQALQGEELIGLMLPCNVVVFVNDAGDTVIACIDPVASMMAVRNPHLPAVAEQIREKLTRALSAV